MKLLIKYNNHDQETLTMHQIEIQMVSSQSSIPESSILEDITLKALEFSETPVSELTIRIVDEQESAYLNETYRHKLGPTNVLSFGVTEDMLYDSPPYLGDLILCAPIMLKESKEQNIELLNHYAHLIVHGILHLRGYDHENSDDAEIMEAKEIEILAKMGFPNPYL